MLELRSRFSREGRCALPRIVVPLRYLRRCLSGVSAEEMRRYDHTQKQHKKKESGWVGSGFGPHFFFQNGGFPMVLDALLIYIFTRLSIFICGAAELRSAPLKPNVNATCARQLCLCRVLHPTGEG